MKNISNTEKKQNNKELPIGKFFVYSIGKEINLWK